MTALEVTSEGECYEMYVWMCDHGVIPDQQCINAVAGYGQFETLKYLYEKGYVPEISSLVGICSRGKLEMVIWFEENNLGLPDEEGANAALENGYLHVVEWLIDKDIRPSSFKHADPDCKDWLERYLKDS